MRIEKSLVSLQVLALVGMLFQSACSGGGSNGAGSAGTTAPSSPASVSLVGVPADVASGSTLPVSAQVVGLTINAMTWTVDGIPNGNAEVGTIVGSGDAVTYTAPANEGDHVLAVASVSNPTISASAKFSVRQNVKVTSVVVNPSTLSLSTGGTNQFSATVTGSGSYNSAVVWSAQLGTITSAGLYTAPTTGGNDVVTATSVQTPSKAGTASVTVVNSLGSPNPASITSVAVSPSTLSLNTGATNQFSATVTGTGSYSSSVTWSVQKGTISSTGLYMAPASACSDVITATSIQDSSKAATSSITVAALSQPVGPVITAVSTSSITQTSAVVSWSLNEVGTGQVFYGPTTAYGSSTSPELSFNYSAHIQTISGLTAGTLYHYCVKSADQAGNLTTSGDYTFSTLSVPNSVTSLVVSPATISLSTGGTNQFSATVTGTGSYSSAVT